MANSYAVVMPMMPANDSQKLGGSVEDVGVC